MAFIRVLCTFLCIAPIFAAPNTFIGNGVEATENRYSVIILALAKPGDHRALFGSGTLISSRHILTAAHLCVNAKQFRIGYGEIAARESIRITVTSALVHSRFNTSTLENDIAIIPLSTKQAIGSNIGTPVWISKVSVKLGDEGTVTSFGFESAKANTISEKLMIATQKVINNTNCVNEYNWPIHRNQFCAQDPNAPERRDDSDESDKDSGNDSNDTSGDNSQTSSGDDTIPNPDDPKSSESVEKNNGLPLFPWSRKARIAYSDDNKISAVCRGDTGSALVKKIGDNYVAIGIVSRVPTGCDGKKPAIYTSVSHFTQWIDDATVSGVNFSD